MNGAMPRSGWFSCSAGTTARTITLIEAFNDGTTVNPILSYETMMDRNFQNLHLEVPRPKSRAVRGGRE